MGPRILILSASIGEGHDLPARMLADGIAAAAPDADVIVLDGLRAMGRFATTLAEDGATTVLHRADRVHDAAYYLLSRWPPSRAGAKAFTHRIGSRGLLALIAEQQPDVIVSTYPGVTEALGHLRAHGRITVPVCSAITDLAALHYWAHPGVDLHLTIHPESRAEILSIAPKAEILCVRGLTMPRFEQPTDASASRLRLGLAQRGPVVVVSGGGWAVGDLAGATEVALADQARATVLALCGRSETIKAALEARFDGEPRVQVMGFTDQMPDVLGAADVLVHSTAGLTVLEALICGCRVISYGWGVAHIRLNNAAYERFGLVEVAAGRDALAGALRAALASPGAVDAGYALRPSAAHAVLRLAVRS